ncbi:MAG: gliding motility-associated C-terminal domain-containing protein, partial [Bacteroidia bacterium]|nr:gliding motility-associated C-terminal domain-containing protein [Bacteroidia bacterium]
DFHGSSVSCKGSTNGSIDITVTKGTAPYSYLWNNNATTQDLSNLGAGFYKVTVTDNNGCIATDSFTLTEPDTLSDEVVIINATCFGANGSIQVNLIGGTTPYSYSWSNGSTQKDLLNVTGGKYTLTVTDLNGCQLIRDYNVLTSSNIALTSLVVPVKCFGEQNGSIDITMQSGTAPFTFTWSNGANTEDLVNIGAGYYKVVVNDAYGCNTSDSFAVTQPPRLTSSLTPSVYYGGFNISRFNAFDGWINLQVQGGTSPYNILRSTGSNLQLISNLPAGKYTVAVSDNNGCLIADSIVLTQPIPLEMPSGFSPNGDGHNDYFVVHGLEAYPVNLLRIFNRWGNEVYTKRNYTNEWNGEDLSNSSLPDGTYFVILDVNNGEITLTGYVDLRRQ